MIVRYLVFFVPALLSISVYAETIAISNARIVTLGEAGTIERGTILIENGRIAEVAEQVNVPEGVTVFDADGGLVTPGTFAPFSQIGLMEVLAFADANDAGNKSTDITAAFDVSYGIKGHTTPVGVARAAGITRAAVFPANGSTIFSGLGALIVLQPEADIMFAPRAFEVVELGSYGAKVSGGARGTAWVLLNDVLDSVAAADFEHSLLTQIDYEALRPVMDGRIPMIAHVERASDILNALELKRTHPKLNLVLSGASAGWRVAGQIAAAEVPVIVCPACNLPMKFENVAASSRNAALLVSAGVTVALSAEAKPTALQSRNLLQAAGIAVANGLPWEEALRGITMNPARIFGVDDDLGSLERGKSADIVVWSGDPFEFSSKPVRVFIEGKSVPVESRQTELLHRYLE